MWIHIAHISNIKCLFFSVKNCSLPTYTWSFISSYSLFLYTSVSAPLYQCIDYISCGETFQNTPQNDDVTRKKKKKTRHPNTFDHLAFSSVCIIFLFHIFSIFLSFPFFHHFLTLLTVSVRQEWMTIVLIEC